MYILGLATMEESSAALLKDGILVAAAEEERFTRVKHEACFPVRAIRFCLEKEGITLNDVERVGVYWQPWRIGRRAATVISTLWRRPAAFSRKLKRSFEQFSYAGGGERTNPKGSWLEMFFVRQLLEKHFGKYRGKIHYLDHHKCHIASAFFVSPFEEATIVTFDGGGEDLSTMMAVGSDRKITILNKIFWPNSLGHFYSSMTGFLGFKMLDGEYKMMGLAPYNTPDYLEVIRKNILITDKSGSFHLNSGVLDYHDALFNNFSREAVKIFGEPRRKNSGPTSENDEPFTERYEKIAASAQAAFEEVAMDLALWTYKTGGNKKNICIAGGCGLNCTANGKILREGPFERIFVPPAPHDAGGSIGAALLVYHEILDMPRKSVMEHAFYGPEFNDHEIAAALTAKGFKPQAMSDEEQLLQKCVEYLVSGKVIAWFQGRMEFGPRALGSRSFLADPRNASIKDVINEKIKERELFRPFAPSVKEECVSDYFEINQQSPFMNITAPVRKEKRNEIPSVTHVDGSARIQTVSRAHNPRYWRLLDFFQKRTGVPVLLNTSFNIQEPIVCTPEEAIETFKRSKVDALAIGDYFITREGRL